MAAARERVARFARRMWQDGLVVGTSGNVSERDPETGCVAITPSGVEYDEIGPAEVVVVDDQGNRVDGSLVPSSELPMHLAIYSTRRDYCGVVHTHSRFATALACLGRELPAIHYLVAYLGDPVPVVPYATYGTQELALQAARMFKDPGRRAVLLQNHGTLSAGESLHAAYTAALILESMAELYWRALAVGEPILLSPEEVSQVRQKLERYGQPSPPR